MTFLSKREGLSLAHVIKAEKGHSINNCPHYALTAIEDEKDEESALYEEAL